MSALFFTLVIGGLVLAVFKLNIFTIKKIDIEAKNITCADDNQLKNYSSLLGRNFFLINFSKTENDLKKKFYCIKSAAVSKSLPDKIKLQILNREPFVVLASLKNKEASYSAIPSADEVGAYYMVDNEGVVFDKGAPNLNLPQIFIYNSEISMGQKLTGKLSNVLVILQKMKTFGIEVNMGRIIDEDFVVDSNPPLSRVIFRLNENVGIQIASLQLIQNKAKIDSSEFEFIDLRFDKPVVKFAPKKS